MALVKVKPTSPGRRGVVKVVNANLQETKFGSADFRNAIMEGCVTRYTVFLDANFDDCKGCPVGW